MARPANIKDIANEDRYKDVGRIETNTFIDQPKILKKYAEFTEIIQQASGCVEKSYGATINIRLPKTKKELDDQLDNDQRHWDEMQRLYNVALKGDTVGDPVPEWRRDSVKRWAEKEGLPNPFDVFAANDPELAAIRADLGLTD